MNRRSFFGAAILAPSATLLATVPDGGAPGLWQAPARQRFPNVMLTTHRNERVRFYDDLVRGNRIVMINMMRVKCAEICGGTMVNLAQVQKVMGARMGREVFMYSITLDPKEDTPEVLAGMARALDAGPGWSLMRARPADTERLRRALGFVDRDPKVDQDRNQHTGMVRAGNDALGRWMSCPGLTRAEQLAQEALWVGLAPRV